MASSRPPAGTYYTPAQLGRLAERLRREAVPGETRAEMDERARVLLLEEAVARPRVGGSRSVSIVAILPELRMEAADITRSGTRGDKLVIEVIEHALHRLGEVEHYPSPREWLISVMAKMAALRFPRGAVAESCQQDNIREEGRVRRKP